MIFFRNTISKLSDVVSAPVTALRDVLAERRVHLKLLLEYIKECWIILSIGKRD